MIYQKLLGAIVIGITLSSCAVHTQADNYLAKYQEAEARYMAKDYFGALQLFQETLPLLKGKKEIVQAQFHQAYAYFYQKSYKQSAHCFGHFYKNYPSIPQAEEALYMQGYALYLVAPRTELDQTDTAKAIAILQNYLAKYPTGVYSPEATHYLAVLDDKLANKAFMNAQLYYQLSHYQAAVVSLTNFQQDFPDADNQEQAAYLKLMAQHKLAQKSKQEEQNSKLRFAIRYCQDFIDHYPNSKHIKMVNAIYKNALVQLEKLIKAKMP